MQAGTKVAFNTFVMYAKVLITVGITLYSTRLVLGQLGAEDFGIFNLVGGIVAMLAFFNGSILVSIQRFLSTAIGMNDKERFRNVLKTGKRLTILLGFIMVVIFEVVGLFLFDGVLNIDQDRILAAHIVFHCIVLSTFFSIVSTPFEAVIIAHEDIHVISLLYILESVLKLGAAIFLIYTTYDKLIVYGVIIALIYINSNIIKRFYCKYKYKIKEISASTNKKLTFELAKFSAFTSIEPLSKIFSIQGVAIILNIFGGTVINAAYGLANQVNGQMIFFSVSLLTAMNPQIMKSEGEGNRDRVLRLSQFACKISFFLLAFFSIPLLIEMPYVLKIWLKNVPDYTILFCRFIVLSTLISQLTYGLQAGIQAVGKIKYYQIFSGMVKIIVLPLLYIALKKGLPMSLAVFSFVVIEIINTIIRLRFARLVINLDLKKFVRNVLSKLIIFFVVVFSLSLIPTFFIKEGLTQLLLVTTLNCLLSLIILKLLILTKNEFKQLYNVLIKLLKRKKI